MHIVRCDLYHLDSWNRSKLHLKLKLKLELEAEAEGEGEVEVEVDHYFLYYLRSLSPIITVS